MKKIKKIMFMATIFLFPLISYAGGEVPESLGGTFNADMVNLLSLPRQFKIGYYAICGLIMTFGAGKSAIKYASAHDDHEKAAAKKEIKKILAFTLGLPAAISVLLAIIEWRFGAKILF